MRYPLRRQILIPLLQLLAITLLGVSAANAWFSASRLRANLDQRMRDVALTLRGGTYPLEANVLRQASGLSGAELAVADPDGNILAASDQHFRRAETNLAAQVADQLQMRDTTTIDGETYFVAATTLDRRATGGGRLRLVLFYPEREFRAAQWQAVFPSLLVGGVALLLAIVVATLVAAQLTSPIHRLRERVAELAQGNFQPAPLPERDDELRDLARDINRMAAMLQSLTEQKEAFARLETLHQVGAGIAHQLRNAATGCRMALDLFRRQEPRWQNDENLAVAVRQLQWMETYLQRFLMLERPTASTERTRRPLEPLVRDVLAMARPQAEHLHVSLELAASEPLDVDADPLLEQALGNLLTNAIEASGVPTSPAPRVEVSLARRDGEGEIVIADNGPGFAAQVAERVGQPFVTSKPEGTGLGIAVARQIIERHGGRLAWSRHDGWTQFVVHLPLAKDA